MKARLKAEIRAWLIKKNPLFSDIKMMDKLSLVQFLLKRFGAVFGVIILLVSGIYYFRENPARADLANITMLEESKQTVERAGRYSQQYLKTKNLKDLEEYNKQIGLIRQQFSDLSVLLKNYPQQQAKFLEVQKKAREYFIALNEKIEKRQSGNLTAERALASLPESETSGVSEALGAMIKDIKENSSEPLVLMGMSMPLVQWYMLVGLLLACYCIYAADRLQQAALDDHRKDVADLKIQSILLDGILNSISEALIVTDEQGNFTRYNTAAQRFIGPHVRSISSDEDAREFGFFNVETLQPMSLEEMPFARALRGEVVEDLEILIHNNTNPEGIYISISSRYLRDIDGSIRGSLAVFRDISKRKAIEQEWMRARESALENARKKSDFLAAMSHEIRTPMNGVMGMATLLAETALTIEQKDYVGTIKRSAEALLRLINDILDHSKIEAGKVQMNLRPFDLRVLCDDVMELFHPMVREKNISLELKFSGRLDWYFVGDPERIRQVLVNLTGNAVKFTEAGGVRIEVECVKSISGKSSLKVSVIDTGAGLSEDESKMLFQKYFQTKTGMKYGGTGLGLSICHQLIELMGGQIGLMSKPGLGSTFWFTIDLPETTVDQLPAEKASNFAAIFKGQVLLAEDQPVNQRVASTYLQKLGLDVDIAANGQIAVEKTSEKNYDLIFMDCQMPVMTGYEATKRIRERGDKTPIVALTAEGTSGEKHTCFTAGMNDFLTKPLELERLTEVLHHWLKSSPQVLDPAALEKLKTYVVNNRSLTEALIEDFEKTAPDLLSSMKSHFEQGNLEGVQQAAHALKSTSATLGATGLARICQKIEDMDSIEDVQVALVSVEDHLKTSMAELQKYALRTAA